MSGTISFSGLSSGIDTSGWVDALVSIKQETVTSMQAKQEEQQKLLDVVNNIKSYFASFQSCLQKITDSQFGITSMDLFQQNLAISTNTNIATATATTEAARQSYEVAVDSLATATKATSGYSQYEVKTATLDTKFGTLGGANGTVTVNSQSFILTTDDTLGTIIQKFKDVGVDADFDEHRGIFTLGVSVSEIDDGATNLKSVLKLQDNTVSGATSGSLVYATRDTEFSKLGLNAGKVNIEGEEYVISKTGDDYTITNADGVTESMNTIGEFLDYLKNSVGAEDATIDSYGNITIKGATLDAVAGGSNIIDILNLSETTDRMVMESNPLTYIEVSAADENTKLSQLGINADTTLVIGGVEHTITNDKTLGQIQTLLKDNGNVDMSIDANGVISIETHGNEISGTLLEVLELDPTKSGATITSQTHNSTWDADGNTLLSDLGVTASDGYIAYKSDGTALNTETTGLAGKTVDEFVEMLKTAGLDVSFDEATSKLVINDGYIEGDIANKLGMSNDEQTYTEAATGATTLEKLGATGNVTLTIDGGAAITYTKDMTLQDVLDDISDAGGVVEFEDGELTVQGVTLGGDIPRLLDLEATTSGTTVTSGNLSVINNNTSTGDEMTETVEYNIDLNSKIGDITGTDTTYTLSVNGGTAQNYTKDTTLSALKTQVENAGGTFAINDDNTVTIAGVELSGTLVGALGFEDTDNGTKFSSVGAITVDGASNVANEDTTLGNLELVSGTNKLTMSIDGGTAIEYGVDDSLGDIFSDIRAAGGTASIDENGYIKVDGVNLTGTVVDKLELIQNSDRTKITSGNIEVVTKTTAESTSVLTGTTNANLSWDSTLGSITGDTKSYTLSVNGAAAQTYTTGTKLSEIKTAITNAGGTMTINADNTITVDGVSLSGTVLDALKLDTTSYDTTISSNTPIYAYGGVKEATGATTFDALGIEDDKRSYAIYKNDGTLVKASSTDGSADVASINDWLAILNTQLNTANGTTGQTYAKIENGVISITGGYITGALPTALGIGTTSEVTGVTMQGSSVTYVTSDPTEYIGNTVQGTGTAGGLVSSDGNSVDSTTQSGSASGNISNDGNLVDTETATGDAVGDASSSGDIGDAETQTGSASGNITNDDNLVDSETATGDAAGDMDSDGNITGTTTQGGYAQGDVDYSGFVGEEEDVAPGTTTTVYDTTSSSSGSIVTVTSKTDPNVTITTTTSGTTSDGFIEDNSTVTPGVTVTTTTSSSSSGGFIDDVDQIGTVGGSNFVGNTSNVVSTDFISTVTNISQVVSTNSNVFIDTVMTGVMPEGSIMTMTAVKNEGFADVANVYTISSAEEFLLFREFINEHNGQNSTFILTSDIDMSGIEWDEAIYTFGGEFYGNGHSIIGLTGTQGLFSHNTGNILHLGIIDADIGNNSDETHAVLVDHNDGTIVNCFTTGNLYSAHNTYQGGLVGLNWGTIGASYSTVVLGSIIPTYVGGLVGGNYGGIDTCYTDAEYGGYMEEGSYYGGLVGYNNGGIANSYSRTNMVYANDTSPSATDNIDGTCGGLVGYYDGGGIDSCYADSKSFIGTMGTDPVGAYGIRNCFVTGLYSAGEDLTDGFDSATDIGTIADCIQTNVTLDSLKSFLGVYNPLFNSDGTFGNETAVNVVSSGTAVSSVTGGTLSEDVYYISSAQDLVKLSELVADGADTIGKTFILKNDIDMTGVAFESIKYFDGKFYGNGHTISNLSIEEHGLFTGLGIDATVQDLGIENINILYANPEATGGLADESYAIINNCWVTGSISETDGGLNVGGLIGRVNAGSVSNSYADVDISTTSDAEDITNVGGLIGYVDASVILFEITNSYSTGNIDTNDVGMYVGGLVGNDEGSCTKLKNVYATGNINGYDCIGGLVGYGSGTIIEQAYYSGECFGECSGEGDVDAIGNNIGDTTNVYYNTSNESSSYGTWLSFSQMQTATTVQGYGFTAENGWNTVDGATPTLGNQGDVISISSIEDDYYEFESGKIYTISTKEDLIQLAHFIFDYSSTTNGAIFVLENDIDFEGEDFAGIAQFDGIFHGNGHVISNVNILESESLDTYTGIFQQLGSTAVVENLGIENATTVVTSGNYYSNYFGVLAGYMEGGATINNCYATGSMNITANSGSDSECIGGLVGYMDTENGEITTINNSYADVDIQINAGYANAVGGLVGRIYNQFDAELTNSYATGDVTGASYKLGGLVGLIESDHSSGDVTIKNVYSTGDVTSTGGRTDDYAGGLIGYAVLAGDGNCIKNAYTTGSVANNAYLTYGGLWGYMSYGSSETTIIENVYCLDTGIQSNGTPDTNPNQYKITESELYDAATMQSKGFTAANGWACVDGSAPKLGGGGGQVNITEAIAAGGTLSSGGMYAISTADDLVALADYVNAGGSTAGVTFVLMNDIDMTDKWQNNGIGCNYTSGRYYYFEGTFEGNGHSLSNLEYNLFDYTKDATIKNLSLTDYNGGECSLIFQATNTTVDNVYVTGTLTRGYYSGGLILTAAEGSVISNCYVDLDISGNSNYYNGGLVGILTNSTIENSYTTGSITISSYGEYGGLVGQMNGSTITNSYSTMDITNNYSTSLVSVGVTIGGIVSTIIGSANTLDTVYYSGTIVDNATTSEHFDAGGIIGYENPSSTVSCTNVVYNSANVSCGEAPTRGTALALSSMSTAATMQSNGFTTAKGWVYEDANSLPTFGNMSSSTETTTETKQLTVTEALAEIGSLSAGNTYKIATAADLTQLSTLIVNGLDTTGMKFVLANDITMGSGFSGLGTASYKFKGEFYGNGHVIKNLTMNSSYTATGLFNYIAGDAVIQDVALENVNIKSTQGKTGALVGSMEGNAKVVNCYVQGGTVTNNATGDSTRYTGGLIGYMVADTCSVSYSYSDNLTVKGADDTGGLIGYATEVKNSYSTADVTGNNKVGGLMGSKGGAKNVTNVYSTGKVTSLNGYAGGIVGTIAGSAQIINAYSVSEVSATFGTNDPANYAGGIAGHITGTANLSCVLYCSDIMPRLYGTNSSGNNIVIANTSLTLAQMTDGTTLKNFPYEYFDESEGWVITADQLPSLGNMTTNMGTTTEVKQLTITEALAEVGSLSSGNTYGISTVADLNKLAELVNGGLDTTGMTFVLTQDINMSSVADFAGIGTSTSKFKGVFDGNGYKIQNMKMENTSTTGLFNYTSGATIKNVGLTDVNIKGGAQTGALVGNADATTISNTYSTGTVTGDSSSYVGGLVGVLSGSTSKIENSFSTATVEGEDNIGGLVGYNNTGTITKSYATGNVIATNMWGAGLVGYNKGTITLSYATGDVNSVEGAGGGLIGEDGGGTAIIVYAAGKVTGANSGGLVGQITSSGTYVNAVYNSTDNTKAIGLGTATGITGLALNVMADGNSMKSHGFSDTSIWTYSAGNFPTLNNSSVQLETSTNNVVQTVTEAIAAGGLVAGNTYAVSSADDLVALATFSNSNSTAGLKFAMTDDIDMSSVDNFAGIQSFAGEFYGNGNEIHNLTISATAGCAGLFRTLTGNAIVRDVGLVDVDISSTSNYVGALVGSTTSGSNIEVANCYVVGGTVKGGHQTGGLIGDMKGTLTESYADVTVIGNADCYNIGGLIGDLNGGTVTQCFAAGDVTGHQQVGGLVGAMEHNATITNCYASGDVTGLINSSFRLGGFVGYMAENSGTINTAYSTGNVTTGSNRGGFVGVRGSGTTITNAVYNSSTGLSKVSLGSSTGISGLTMEQMVTQSEMEAKGFTSIDDGGVWEYNAVDGQKPPSFGIGDVLCPAGKVYVSDVADPGFQTFVKGDTYYIGTENDLNCLIYMVNHYGADTTDVSFVLENDIVMTSAITEGIGAYPNAFNGNFYGNGHTISNLEISGSQEVALFAYTEGALIKDVGIVNAKVTSTNDFAAILVAYAYNTTIENCYATGTVDGGGNYTGGLVGAVEECEISNSYADVDVDGSGDHVGGLVGWLYNTTLESCYATGNITNNNNSAGGLIGSMEDSSVWKCYATGNVDGYSDAGGFVGSILGASDLEHCYSTGAVTWGDCGGGFAGYAYGDDITVYGGCVYNTGSGDVVLNTDSDERFVGLAIEDMRNQSIMEAQGFTEDEGWVYITGATPTLGNVSVTGGGKVYVSTLTDFKVGDTYYINSEADLQKLAELVNAGKKTAGVTFVMENDIALTEEFTSIGYANGHAFSGDFYGNGHTISGLVIDKDSQYAGLFGLVHNGKIQDLGIINANVKGANFTGILAGSINQNSEIYNCYVSGTVTGSIRTGGLVGAMIFGTITDSYSSATVSGSSYVGGLVGSIQNSDIRRSYASGDVAATGAYSGGFVGISGGQIEDAYATGDVRSTAGTVGGFVGYITGDTASIKQAYSTGRAYGTSNVGGFVGNYGSSATIENAVYNSSTGLGAKGTGASTGITGLTLIQMSNQTTMEAQGFTSYDDGGCWKYIANATPTLGDAVVSAGGSKIYVSNADVTEFKAGNTYYIATADDLAKLSTLVNAGAETNGSTFILEGDVDMTGVDFAPIGTFSSIFEGDFYGNGHTIDNLTIDSSSDYVGLFGCAKGSTIQDVGLTNVNISGADYVGALVGNLDGGEIKNAYVLGGTVSGGIYVGGLVGSTNVTIRDSYSTANVSGVSGVGGLAGYVYGAIVGSYATGNVTATSDYVGGLVGSSLMLAVRDSYTTGNVTTSGSYAGGIVGYVEGTGSLELTQVYSSGKIIGTSSGGLIGGLATNSYTIDSAVYNKGSGDVVVNASGVGEYGSGVTEATTITAASIEDMRNKSYMEAQGFTEADGWIYVDYTTPTRGNVSVTGGGKVYVSTLTDFTVGDTYFISTEADLKKLAELVNAGKDTSGVTFVMENDITLTEEFTPIGRSSKAFKGDFYGNGHKISNLSIDASDTNYIGLFGYLDNAKVRDLGIENADVKGKNYTGILAGRVDDSSEIYNCYATGSVEAADFVGGLIGILTTNSVIYDSYSTADVSGEARVGGFVGYVTTQGVIRRSYATGDVTATGIHSGGFVGNLSAGAIFDSYATGEIKSTSSSVGGFVGYMTGSTASIQSSYSTGRAYGTTNVGGFVGNYRSGTINYSVYNSSTGLSAAGTGNPTGVTGLTLTQMSNQATMEAQGFTSVDDGGCWKYIANATPTLGDAAVSAGGSKIYVSNADVTEFKAGNTYYIASADDITKIAELVNAGAETSGSTFILDGDVDMSGVDFESIGTASNAFEGTFYGNGNVIQNLTGDSGLFGYVNNSTIQDIGIENANITATDSNIGILVDNAEYTSIINCYTTGTITGTTNVGGLVGYAIEGTIQDSYSSASVSGVSSVGGLVGYIFDNHITNSYAIGNVTASDTTAGALVGSVYSNRTADASIIGNVKSVITSSFATGNVTATNGKVGGLVGYLDGEVINSYSTGRITGSTALGGIAGETNDATLSGNVYNSSTGITTSVGTGASATNDTVGLIITQMTDRTIMESHGFTTDKGWVYYTNTTPQLSENVNVTDGGKVYVNSVDRFVAGETYYISTVDDMKRLAELVNNGDNTENVTFVLENDIDMSSVSDFDGIGISGNTFKGDFYGNGNVISGLKMTNDTNATGLFNRISDAVIRDLGVVGATISGTSYVGILAGLVGENTVVENCYVTGTVNATGNYVGGLAGHVNGSGLVMQSYSSANVTSTGAEYTGGLIGLLYGKVTNCYADGTVTGVERVGGLVGNIMFATALVESSYSSATVNGTREIGGLIGRCDGGKVINCYSNSTTSGSSQVGTLIGNYQTQTILSGNYATGTKAIGTNNASSGFALLTQEQLEDQSLMESYGFTADKGWVYYENQAPKLRAESGLNAQHSAVTLETVFEDMADSTVAKDLYVTVNGLTYSRVFNGNETVKDAMIWLDSISTINASFDEATSTFSVTSDYEDLLIQGGVANLLFGGNANVEYEEITVNTDSNYLQEEADGSKIWAGTKIKDVVAGSEYTIGYKDEAGNIVMQSFDGEQSLGDVFYWLLSKGIVSSVNDGVYTATKEGGSPTDIYGTIGTSLKGRNGTTVVEGSNYVSSESLTSESSSNATGTTKLKDMGIESGTIHVVDGDGNILDTVTIDNEMTINEVSTLLATKGVAMSISGGKVTATTDSTNRIIDGSSNMVSAMKLSNWQETEGKLTGTSTIAQMGFSDGTKLGVSLNGVSYTLSFDADDTLNDVISQLSTLDITASVDANGKFSATSDGIIRFSNELGSYLTQNSVLGYEKIADGYVSEENFEYSSASQTLTKNTTIGTLLGNDVGGTLRVTIDGNNVYDLQYSANDTVNDIIADLAGLGITADVNGGVFTAISVSNTFTFADNVGKAISGNTPQYTELTTGYVSDDLSYEIEDTATLDSTLKELGISSGNILVMDDSGNILQKVSVDESYTLNQIKSMLSSNGLDLSIDTDGKVTVSSDKGYKIGDGTSNMVSKLGLDTWTKSSETLTEDTTIAEIGFKDGADLNLFLDGTTMNVLSFDGEETLQDVMFALSAYGIDCSIDADGKFTATSKEHTFVMSSTLGSYLTKGTTGYVNDSTGYETYKPLVEEKPLVGAVSEELDYQEKMTMDSTLESLGYQDGGNVRVLLDNGTVYNLSFLGSNKISDVVYALSAYGIDADVVDGKFKAESIDNTFTISGNFGSYLVSGGTYQTEVTGYESVAHTYETEKDVDYNTKLSDLGVAKGSLNVIKEGQLQGTAITITDNTTVRQLFNAIQPYGLTGDIKTDAAGNKYIEIQGNNTYLADGTSNVVSGLGMISVRQGDFNGNVTYWNDDADAGLVTEDMLITNFDRDGFTGVGSLIFETGSGDDAVEHIVNITTTDTVGSLITKLNAQGLDASLDKGRITISSGLDGISFKGGTSGIVRTMGLDIEDVDTYCESSSAITYDGETSYSAANFADANTKLDIVNVTQGTLSVFVDGVKCTIDVNPNESFKDLFTKITDAVAARTGQTIKVGFLDKNGNILTGATSVGNANNTGVIAMSIDEGHELVIGASNDTTNFATIANLNKTEWNEVVGSRALYKVNINSKITESGLFRDGQITEGTFTIGDAEFTIDANTTLKSLMEQINKSEKSYATAYWDTLSGTMVIQSTLTGASLINIEAGTSNFTDIMGFTVEKSGTSALVTSSQKLGQNAVVRINGTMVTASSNVITSDVSKIKGLTINLRNVSEGETVTITVEQNKEGIYEAVADTLDAYNAMMEALDKELTDKSTLGNESILKLMRNNLKRLMTSSLGGSYVFRNLSAIGISTGEASDDISKNVTSLLIDKDKFLEALSGDSDAVQNLLVGTTATPGIFLQANNIVENAISASGYFSNMADTLTRNISKLNEKIMKTNLSIEDYKSKLERRFHNMELTISGLQSSYSNFLNL